MYKFTMKLVKRFSFQREGLIQVGQVFTLVKSFSLEEVKMFAQISTDHNPIHLDEQIAKQSRFKQRIVHGILGVSLFSGLMGNNFNGAIYLNQTVRFIQPIYLDEQIEAKITVMEILLKKNDQKILKLKTTIEKVKDQILAIDGEANILI